MNEHCAAQPTLVALCTAFVANTDACSAAHTVVLDPHLFHVDAFDIPVLSEICDNVAAALCTVVLEAQRLALGIDVTNAQRGTLG